MDKSKYEEIMKERYWIRKYIEDNYGLGEWCNELIEIIKEDIPGFIDFLKTECSSKDFLFITDWFEEFVQEIRSQELVDAFRETLHTRFAKENEEYHIERELDMAIEDYGNGELH